ncbi:MAG: hypothetical protein QM791_12435 [Ferruginibacter sp.]
MEILPLRPSKNTAGKREAVRLCLFFLLLAGIFQGFSNDLQAQSSLVKINTRLYLQNSSSPIRGMVVVYNNTYSEYIDENDGPAIANSGENIAMIRRDTLLVSEGRPTIVTGDTLRFMIWGMRADSTYRLDFTPQNLDAGLYGLFIDSFANPTGEVLELHSGLVSKNFTVTADPNSGGGGVVKRRFTVILAHNPALPVIFTGINTQRIAEGVKVNWQVEHESGIVRYEIERSPDGRFFQTVGSVSATRAADYSWIDKNSINGNSFYRIKSIDADGKVKFTNIAKNFAHNIRQEITVIPNLIENGLMNLQVVSETKGRYELNLVNISGQVVYKVNGDHTGGTTVRSYTLPESVKQGVYQAVSIAPDKTKIVQKVIVH